MIDTLMRQKEIQQQVQKIRRTKPLFLIGNFYKTSLSTLISGSDLCKEF